MEAVSVGNLADAERADVLEFARSQQRKGHHVLAAAMFALLYEAGGTAVALLNLGINLRLSGDLEHAEQAFEEFATKFPTNYGYCMEAGMCKMALRKFEPALALFDRAYQQDQTGKAATWIGVCLVRQQRCQEALDWLEKGSRLDPDFITAKIEMANALFQLQRFDEAAGFCETVLKSLRGEGSARASLEHAYFLLGSCFERAGHHAKLAGLTARAHFWAQLTNPTYMASAMRWVAATGVTLPPAAIDEVTLHIAANQKERRNNEHYRTLLATSSYGQDALAITEAYPFTELVSRLRTLDFVAPEDCLAQICKRIADRQPTCLIRLGDGEGNFLAVRENRGNQFLLRQADLILNTWFGRYAEKSPGYDQLYQDIAAALLASDFVGIPDIRRLNLELHNVPRGYWGVYFAVHQAMLLKLNFVVAGIHHLLLRSSTFISTLGSVEILNTISCHREFGSKLRAHLGVRDGMDVVVPGEMGLPQLPEENRQGNHYRNYYFSTIRALRTFAPGSVTLIGAGICGKIYAHQVKEAGGIGIDIGAMADFFMGLATRSPFTDANFRKHYQWMGSDEAQPIAPTRPDR